MSICLRRRIGVLMPFHENNPVPKLGLSAFTQALADLGWTDGRNVRIDLRSVAPKSSAPASEVIASPSKRRNHFASFNGCKSEQISSTVVQFIGIGASLESLESRFGTTTFADSALRCS